MNPITRSRHGLFSDNKCWFCFDKSFSNVVFCKLTNPPLQILPDPTSIPYGGWLCLDNIIENTYVVQQGKEHQGQV